MGLTVDQDLRTNTRCTYTLFAHMVHDAVVVGYWREYDIVLVHINHHRYVGILDGWVDWPIQKHCGPREFDPEGKMWHVRVKKLTHCYIAVARSPGLEYIDYIIENKTMLIYVCRIQRWWRKQMTRRNTAATLIQRLFRESISNPYHLMCGNRLLREFSCMESIYTCDLQESKRV